MAEVGAQAIVKRAGNLWQTLVSYPNLFAAARAAAAGKRTRPDAARFFLDLENEIVRMRAELIDRRYVPGPYRCFRVLEPKPRLISAAPFRDRVVHHALTRVVEPVFEKRFLLCSYACRKGFGTHRAIAAARRGCGRHKYVLKCDIRKYFPSIDHGILKMLLARAVKCPRTLDLAARIIDGSNPQEEAASTFRATTFSRPMSGERACP